MGLITVFLFFFVLKKQNSFLLPTNLIHNPSFEEGLNEWNIKSSDYLNLNHVIKLEVDKNYIDKPMIFEYFPEKISGELTKSTIVFDFFNKNEEFFSRLTYVVSGLEDYWSYQDIKKDNINYLTYIKNTKSNEWNKIIIDTILKDYNKKIQQISSADVMNIENISKIICTFNLWSLDGEIKVKYKNVFQGLKRLEYDNEIVNFQEYKNEESSIMKSFFYLPSNGNNFLRILSEKNNFAVQEIKNVNSDKKYLLLLDFKNEFGLITPQVSVLNDSGEVIVDKKAIMQMAQNGWTRSGIVFSTKDSSIFIKLGSEDSEEQYYSNNYDNLYLYEIPIKNQKAFFQYIKDQHSVSINNILDIKDKEVDYLTLLSSDLQKELSIEYDTLGIPIYDLYFDEYEAWQGASNLQEYWKYRINSKNMISAELIFKNENKKVKIKTRGIMPYHHVSRNKSFRVDLSKNERFDLIRPATRDFLAESFSYYLANKIGLISLRNEFVFLRINNKPIGIDWKYQRTADDLELNKRPEGYLIGTDGGRYLFDEEDDSWESYAKPTNKEYIENYPREEIMSFFINLLKKKDLGSAVYMVDLEKFFLWGVHSVLMGSAHQVSHENNMMYWNSSAGRLEWVPWDVRFGSSAENDFQRSDKNTSTLFDHYNPFIEEFLENFEYYNLRNRLLWEYVKNTKNLYNDLNSYEELYKRTRTAFSKTTFFESPLAPANSLNIIPFEYIDGNLNAMQDIYSARFNSLKTRLSMDQKTKILFSQILNPIFYNNQKYKALRVQITPLLKKIFSSTLVENLSSETLEKNKTYFLFNIANKNKLASSDGLKFNVQKYIPSDLYFEYKIEFFWRDNFHDILEKLKNNSEDFEFFRSQYDFIAEQEYRLKEEALNNPLIFNKLFKLLQSIGEIKEQKELTFYILYPYDVDMNPLRDINFLIKNGVTNEPIVSETIIGDSFFQAGIEKEIIEIFNKKELKGELEEDQYEEININSGFNYNYPFKYFTNISASKEQFLEKYPVFKSTDQENVITLDTATHKIKSDIVISKELTLALQPGTTLKFAKGVSLVSYGKIIAKGTKENPIVFTAEDKGKPWGVLGLLREDSTGEFENCLFEYGGEAYINGVYFSGMLSAHYTQSISVRNSVFQYASRKNGDDALNFKNTLGTVEKSYFYKNSFDAIDFDFMEEGSKIIGCSFLENGNDGMDISGSKNVILSNNKIEKSGDKGISLGEEAEVLISNNIIEKNNHGVAVKDLSKAKIENNNIIKNKIGVSAYNKKEIFGGGNIAVYNTLLEDNKLDFGREKIDQKDDRSENSKYYSQIFVYNSKYRTTNNTIKEVIKEPEKKVKSKKAFLQAYINNDLQAFDYQFAILEDKAKSFEAEDEKYKNKIIGIEGAVGLDEQPFKLN